MPLTRAVISARAAELAKNSGLITFPFDPIMAANWLEIHVESQPDMQGATGAISLTDDPVIYHPPSLSPGLLNFSLGHELGHYFISGHTEQIIAEGGQHFSRGGTFSHKKPIIEQEADHFAANFLMPNRLTKSLLENNNVGLDGILQLHKSAVSSITSSAIRSTQCDPYPIAIIMVGADGRVKYSFRSSSFCSSVPGKHLARGAIIPSDSAALRMSADNKLLAGERERGLSTSYEWFGEGNKRLDVETFHLGRFGTLVVLSGEEKWDEDDEEDDLLESWTPRFKK